MCAIIIERLGCVERCSVVVRFEMKLLAGWLERHNLHVILAGTCKICVYKERERAMEFLKSEMED